MASSKKTLDEAVRYFQDIALPDAVKGGDLINIFRRHREFTEALTKLLTTQKALLISFIEDDESEQSLGIEPPKQLTSIGLRIWKHFKSQYDLILPYVEVTRSIMAALERVLVGEPHQGSP